MARAGTHNREFKLEVVRQVTSGEKRPAQVCREHGLAESLLLRWRKEVEARGEAAFTTGLPSEPERLARRVEELEQFCDQLALENAVLKNLGRQSELKSRVRRADSGTTAWHQEPADGPPHLPSDANHPPHAGPPPRSLSGV